MSHEINELKDLISQKDIEIKEVTTKLNNVESLNKELKQKLQEEKDCNTQALEALRQENEQLHLIINEDNSKYEVLLIDKEKAIDSIVSVMKNNEDLTLAIEKLKLELQKKEEVIGNLTHQIINLKQDNNRIDEAYNETIEQIKEITKLKEDVELQLKSRILMLQETLSIVEKKCDNLIKEKDAVVVQYNEEKTLRNCLQLEKDNILQENVKISDDNKQLCKTKTTLTQELLEQKSANKIIDDQKNCLIVEKSFLEDELDKVVKIKTALLDEKDCLTQQVIEEKSALELLVKEKENLFQEKENLAQQLIKQEENRYKVREDFKKLTKKYNDLSKEYNELKIEKQSLATDIDSLKKENLEMDELSKEKQSLIYEKEKLEEDFIECKAINNALLSEKELLLLEKEALVVSLGHEKSVLDEIENEKNTLKNQLEDLCKKHELELIQKNKELQNRTEEITQLKIDCEGKATITY